MAMTSSWLYHCSKYMLRNEVLVPIINYFTKYNRQSKITDPTYLYPVYDRTSHVDKSVLALTK